MSRARSEPFPASPPPRDSAEAPAQALEAEAEAGGAARDWFLGQAGAAAPPGRATALDAFLAEKSPLRALKLWLLAAPGAAPSGPGALGRRIRCDMAAIDAAISRQVNTVIHTPRFQRLEASWRGLQYLVRQAGTAPDVKIKVLNAGWRELARDAQRAAEFDQSQLFRKVYENEFGMSGGEPFGVLLGDYEIRHTQDAGHPVDDMATLSMIAQVAAASFAPFIAAASPALFGIKSFSLLERPMNLARIFDEVEYARWRELRAAEDARFVGLTLPRVLMRLPYGWHDTCEAGFIFREDVGEPGGGREGGGDADGYLWGNACYAFGAVLIRAFAQCGWFAEIRGVRRDMDDGGLVTGLPLHAFGTDRSGLAFKSSTDLVIDDQLEKELSGLGFIPLCQLKDVEDCAFFSTGSIQRPKDYREQAPTVSARISAMLQYMFCVSRFAHYVKIRMRDKIGSLADAREVEDSLSEWIHGYVAPDADAAPAVRARFPLREARIQVTARPDKQGIYQCVMHLLPHSQLDAVTATVTLRTEQERGRTV